MNPEQVDRYKILSELGHGGMATVYLAHDPRFNRKVAIKTLPRQFTHDAQFISRFRHEAETVASLEHQNIVPVYDYGEQDDLPYLVMRHMSGGSLQDRMKGKKYALEEAIKVLKPIASALDYAHEKGVIHRDVKPGNILFDEKDAPFLSDFGIVRLAESTASFTGSSVIGTPAYMSPEQIEGGTDLDGRSDIYSLGIVVYELLTGEVPYKGDTPTQQLMKHVLEPVPRISDKLENIDPAIELVITRGLSKSPDERFSSAEEFISAMQQAMTGDYQAPAAAVQTIAGAQTMIDGSSTMLPETSQPANISHGNYQPLPVEAERKGFPIRLLVGGLIAIFLVILCSGAGIATYIAGVPTFGRETLTSTPGIGTRVALTSTAMFTGAPAADISETPTESVSLVILPTDESVSPSPTLTITPSPTPTETSTPNPTITQAPTNTSTFTPSPTFTPIPTTAVPGSNYSLSFTSVDPQNGSTLTQGSIVQVWYQLENSAIGGGINNPSHINMAIGIVLVKDPTCRSGAEESVIQQWVFFWPAPHNLQTSNTTFKIADDFPIQSGIGANSVKVVAVIRNGDNEQVGDIIQSVEMYCFPFENLLKATG